MNDSQPVPVEPPYIPQLREYLSGVDKNTTHSACGIDNLNSVVQYIDTLLSQLQAAQQELPTDWYLQAKRSDEMAKAWEREARVLFCLREAMGALSNCTKASGSAAAIESRRLNDSL